MEKIDGLISILMGVYNCESTVGKAIESILSQTYERWELIICDDGSNDGTLNVVRQYESQLPQKIKVLSNETNLGLNATLNRCLEEASGEFVARQDGDDWSMSDRFYEELSFLRKHPEYDFVSCGMHVNDGQKRIGDRIPPKGSPVPNRFIYGSCFAHAPCMIRRSALLDVQGYTVHPWLLRVEDYHLWVKLYAKGHKGANMPVCLYEVCEDVAKFKRRRFRSTLNLCYAKLYAVKALKLPKFYCLYCLVDIGVALLPLWLYRCVHRLMDTLRSKRR